MADVAVDRLVEGEQVVFRSDGGDVPGGGASWTSCRNSWFNCSVRAKASQPNRHLDWRPPILERLVSTIYLSFWVINPKLRLFGWDALRL